jgi:hypothetical protein
MRVSSARLELVGSSAYREPVPCTSMWTAPDEDVAGDHAAVEAPISSPTLIGLS